jgi:hypothetical protein
VRWRLPSSAKRSATATRRSPAVDARLASAPIAQSTGAVSDEQTAQQRGDPGATQQVFPSFLRQKPIASRQRSLWS